MDSRFCRIMWKSPNGTTGHGDWASVPVGQSWIDHLTKREKDPKDCLYGYHHWLEYK